MNHAAYAGRGARGGGALVARCAACDPFALAVTLAAEGRIVSLVIGAYAG
ncbi:hypothetical protein [Burkholderia ambifaria]|nr:hypothetical protein [Burkholderia ambifaria]MBR8252989.1 hypothetical protein [Burkholderia ambifaria]